MLTKKTPVSNSELPRLAGYRKAILLHGVSAQDIRDLLGRYAYVHPQREPVEHRLGFTTAPHMNGWLYLRYEYSPQIENRYEFYYYQELLLWLGQLAASKFCLAASRGHPRRMFYAEVDRNPFMVATTGVYRWREFSYGGDVVFRTGVRLPDNFSMQVLLRERQGFLLEYLPKQGQNWEECTIQLPASIEMKR